MPYAKMSGRKHYRKRGYNTRDLAKKAYSLAKKAEGKKELKHNAISITDTSPDTTGALQELSVLAQGDTNNTRDGDVIYPTSIKMRGVLSMAGAASDTYVRFIVFRWKSGSPSAITDILVSGSVISFKSEANRFQSEILMDKVVNLNDSKSTSVFIQKSLRCKKYIGYNQSTTAANRNSIWLLTLSNESTNAPTLTMGSRLYFKDA